ncbi:hypothetical protein DFQ30_004540, partial [Apophysomyces sp. BC1015]
GFMLAETCIAIAISWVLAAWAVPSFDDWRVRQQVRVAARALARALSLARSEAVTRQMRVTVCRSDGKGGCVLPGRRCATGAQDWSCGWLVQAEPGGAARAIVLHWQPPLKDVMITGSATSMTFVPPAGVSPGSFRGFAVRAARTSPRVSALHVRVSTGGRAQISTEAYRK